MRRLSAMCAILIASALSAAAQSAAEHPRFLLVEREVPIETEGSRGVVVELHLFRFDTATGQAWRYTRRNWNDPAKQASYFIRIPIEGIPEDGKKPGRFQLMARSGGKATQPFPDVLILDDTTGKAWVYRGVRRSKDGTTALEESFVLIKETDS